ncbi:Dyp-type peroxidase [Antrihabitans cavernicola]|uniref:Dyp-type peroxidase n=1 Tax=Antrihabitans cavernicola TaxID=2495913 RepID=A0A5A7SCQ8_9NOCA|nr:Dyp-type peroxidase [Spelaeibacter cavernicola]KAA0023940.1 Dyp-type peroxidase [Spelaeibacter cavernicola]
MTPQLPRRALLRGGVGLAGLAAAASTQAVPVANAVAAVPFHGENQAGILPEPQPYSVVLAANAIAGSRAELADLFRTITDRARFLTAGGDPDPVGITAPATDSGTLGSTIPAGGLTVTLGVGASLFDDRYGLQSRKPTRLDVMTPFPDDDLKPEWCHGDLSLVVSAPERDTVLHAVRDIARNTRGGMQFAWRQDGFVPPPRPSGAPRNHFGFKDGTSNPDVRDPGTMKRLVWAASDDQPWTAGGSYQVVRLIRMLVEFWDRISVGEQENLFGRARATGAPLDGTVEGDVPDYSRDGTGKVIPLTSHMRLANPRTDDTDDSRILRRSHSYDAGLDTNGNLDLGLVFVCYQQDIARQFVATQTRLDGEPLSDYISPFGGGYFFALPGVRNQSDYLGRRLFE